MIIIYGLHTNKSDSIRYVGKTKKSLHIRLAQHINRSDKDRTNLSVSNWIRSEQRKVNKILIKSLEEATEDNWQLLEKKWIKKLAENDLKNIKPGGEYNADKSVLPDNIIKRIRELYAEGFTALDIRSMTEFDKYTFSSWYIHRLVRGEARLEAGGPITKGNANKARKHKITDIYKKLSRSDVIGIIDLIYNTDLTYHEIGQKYNISYSTVLRISKSITWKEIPHPHKPIPQRPENKRYPHQYESRRKLTNEQVNFLRKNYPDPQPRGTWTKLAQEYKVDIKTIQRAARGIAYQHVLFPDS